VHEDEVKIRALTEKKMPEMVAQVRAASNNSSRPSATKNII